MRIGFDATPIADLRPMSGHGVRGIGRCLAGILDALDREAPAWAARHLRYLVAPGQRVPIPGAMPSPWVTHRPGPLPQHVGWLAAAAADRWSTRGSTPDLWHVTDPSRPFGPLPDRRTIVSVHDVIPLREPRILSAMRPHQRLVYRRYLRLAKRAALVITYAAAQADVAELLGVAPERIRSITPWVRPPAIPSPSGEHAAEGDALQLLVVGVSMAHKRFELAIATLASLRRDGYPASLRICGVQPPAVSRRLLRLAERAGVADSMQLLGRVDDERLTGLYARSVLLATSSIEGIGLPPIEAILCGGRVAAVPTAAYRDSVGEVAEMADRAEADPLAAAALRAVRRAPDRAAIERVAARFSARTCATSVIAAYESVMATQA